MDGAETGARLWGPAPPKGVQVTTPTADITSQAPLWAPCPLPALAWSPLAGSEQVIQPWGLGQVPPASWALGNALISADSLGDGGDRGQAQWECGREQAAKLVKEGQEGAWSPILLLP